MRAVPSGEHGLITKDPAERQMAASGHQPSLSDNSSLQPFSYSMVSAGTQWKHLLHLGNNESKDKTETANCLLPFKIKTTCNHDTLLLCKAQESVSAARAAELITLTNHTLGELGLGEKL